MNRFLSTILVFQLLLIQAAPLSQANHEDLSTDKIQDTLDLISSTIPETVPKSPLPVEDPNYLGQLVDASDQRVIQIRCIEGDQKNCTKIGFFLVVGIPEPKPFATRNGVEDMELSKPKFFYNRVSGPVYKINTVKKDYNDKGKTLVQAVGIGAATDFLVICFGTDMSKAADNAPHPFRNLLGVPIALVAPFVLDVLLTPYSLIKYWIQRSTYKKAAASLIQALTTGHSVRISHRVFKRVHQTLSQTK